MGYYTVYELTLEEELLKQLRTMDADVADCLDETGSGVFQAKWYDHDTSLLALSEKCPDKLITLDGHGEEAGDCWRKFYRNGKMELVKWAPPDKPREV